MQSDTVVTMGRIQARFFVKSCKPNQHADAILSCYGAIVVLKQEFQ